MSVLEQVTGRVVDVDSHEFIPALHWEREFGPLASALAAMVDDLPESDQLSAWNERIDDDDADIDVDTVWKTKGSRAPSAIDLRRRPSVLDVMGIDTQIVFPTGPGFIGLLMATGATERLAHALGFSDVADPGVDTQAVGRAICTAYNDWCIRTSLIDRRVRPAAVIDTTSIDLAIAEAQRVIDAGVRVAMIASDVPPGGKSPAHLDNDALWRVFADANVPVVLHVGTEWNFKKSAAWSEGVPAFDSRQVEEASLNPYHFSQVHFSAQHFLSTMILGGVFERHPSLRFGVMELTSHWVGPMAENLQMWVDQFATWRGTHLPLTPAEYLQRNVRVSSFYWEPVDRYVDRFGLEDVYVYGSDFPHLESGSENSVEAFASRLERLGPGFAEKFFVTNGRLLTP